MGTDRNSIAHDDERWRSVLWSRSRSGERSCEGRRRECRREHGVVMRKAARRPKRVFHGLEGRSATATSRTRQRVRKGARRTWYSPTARKERGHLRRDRNGPPSANVPVRGRWRMCSPARKRKNRRRVKRRPQRRRGRSHRCRARFPRIRRLPAGRRPERQPM